jgi:hypothetical protein
MIEDSDQEIRGKGSTKFTERIENTLMGGT